MALIEVMTELLHISIPRSVMRILQPAGSTVAVTEATTVSRKRRVTRQEVIVTQKKST